MTKRQRFITISAFLTIGLFLVSRVGEEYRVLAGLGLSACSVLFTYLALRRELEGLEFLTLLSPSFLLTLGFSLIFFFFPNFNIVFTLIIYASFAVSIYSCLLSCNIFSASAVKDLLLLKPAQTTFSFILVSVFFLLQTHLYKLEVFFIAQIIISVLLATFLAFLVFWSQGLNKTLSFSVKLQRQFTVITVVTLFLLSWGLNFLPLQPFFRGLVMTACFNAILGICIAKLSRQISNKIILEYLLIPLVALVFSFVMQ